MAASHAEERLAACSFQELSTGAQYKREDLVDALETVADVVEEDVEEENDKALRLAQAPVMRDGAGRALGAGAGAGAGVGRARARARARRGPGVDFNTNTSSLGETQIIPEDFVDFADIYHSNEEYFRKLKELKTAHIETMAKLERMDQNKLRFKEVQPLIIRENTCSASSGSLSENNYQPVSLVTSLSELDICRSPSMVMSSSEDELPDFKTVYPQKKEEMNYAKELINNMWRNFSVEDYIQSKSADFPTSEKIKKKPKAWVSKITVPEPFQMTIREEKKKEQSMKFKSELEALHKIITQTQEDLECKKKFRANPVPSFIFFPSYREIVKQNEERRRYMKEKNKEALLASLKPFKFVVREEQKQAIREKQLRDFLKCKKKTNQFKAKPVPRSTYGSSANDLFKEEFQQNPELGSLDRLQYSFPVASRLVLGSLTTRKPKNTAKVEKLNKHKIKYQTANFEDPPETDQKHLSEQKYYSHLKYCQSYPYAPLLTVSKRENKFTHVEADEQNLKHVCELSQSLRRRSGARSANAKFVPSNYNPPMPTISSRGREQAIRRSLEEKKMLEEDRNRILTKQKQRMKELQKLLINRAKAYDSHQSLAQVSKSRVKSLRKSGRERMREYRRELEEREERLKNRPLLFERVSQKNARMAAEKHYSNTLKAVGISDEFVSKKGQSGRVFEYFKNQEMKNFMEDKESFNEEEKVEERENGDMSYLIDTNSQDSCEEKDEDHEESGEEKSVEE
ncbi:protein FAM161A [Sorex fumeus]|uniref:protein FAM161A n=1 Tax=Sorex fumeus TaxID=62283 RepID=UPI0024AE3D96|nr:protein FAM161A [Sorex fumeus]